MKTRLRSVLTHFVVSAFTIALLATLTGCSAEGDGSSFRIETPGSFENLTELTDISGSWNEGDNSGTLTAVPLTLMRYSDNKFWNGASWGSSFNLPTTVQANDWQLAAGTSLPAGGNLQPDYYLIEAYGDFTQEDSVVNRVFTVGVPAPPVLPAPWAWGSGHRGKLGVGSVPESSSPVPVFMRGALDGKVLLGMAAGDRHTLALSTEGRLYSWGDDGEGQLGSTAPHDTGEGVTSPINLTPVKVDDTGVLSGKKISRMAAGFGHSLACSSPHGLVFAWGSNEFGEIGNGSTSGPGVGVELPVAVTGILSGKKIIAVSAGFAHSIALDKTGAVYAWGHNAFGKLGDGTSTNRNVPVAVTGLAGVVIAAVAAGWDHNLALTDGGKVYTWGSGGTGQLGNGSTADSNVPLLIPGPWGTRKIVYIAAGRDHSLAVDEDGKVYAWGNNVKGQLGTGDEIPRLSPVQVTGALAGQHVHHVKGGDKFSVAITRDNRIFTWGFNDHSQFARPTLPAEFSNAPQEADVTAALSGGRMVLHFSAGSEHVMLLTGFSVKPEPEIEVEAQGVELADGDTINCGAFAVGTSNPVWITIRNSGGENLADLKNISVTLSDANFNASFSQPSLAPNGETGFYVHFAPVSAGALTSAVQIFSNDTDENPFNIMLAGTATPMGQVDLAFDPGVLGDVHNMSVQPDGKVVIGGTFVRVSGPAGPDRKYAARVDGATGAADSFDPVLSDFSFNNCSLVLPDGKVMIGGAFTTIGNPPVARNRLARLIPDGTLDAGFDAQIPFSGTVHAMALQGDGKIMVTGNFSNIGGSGRQYLARLNTDGTVDTAFAPVLNSSGRGVVVQPDGNVIVCGAFTTVNGQGFNKLARVSGVDGTLDPGFSDPGIVTKSNSNIECVAVQANGKILVGGNLQTVNGDTRNGMCRLNADGTLDTGFNPDVNNRVTSIVVQADGRILISGQFTSVGGLARNRIAMLLPNGQVVEPWFDPNANSVVNGVTLQADGKILVGGSFSTIGGEARSNLARLSNDTATQALKVEENNTRIEWLRGGASPETNLVTFDVSSDGGVTWTPLGPGTRMSPSTPGWQLTGVTLPAVGHIRARAYPQGAYYNGSVSCLETIATYGTPPNIVVTENSVPVMHGSTRQFGVIATGTGSSLMQLTIQNTGGSTLTGLGAVTLDDDLSVVGEHQSLFQLVRPGANSLAPGASTTMAIRYNPRTPGRHAAILRIPSNDTDTNPFGIFLTGLGSQPFTTHKQQKTGDSATADTAPSGLSSGQNLLSAYATGTTEMSTDGDGTSISPPDSGGGGSFAPSTFAGESEAGDPPPEPSFIFNYRRNKLALADIVFQVEWSDTLATNDWHTTGVTEIILSDDDSIQQVKATVPAGTAGRRFVRLKMTRP